VLTDEEIPADLLIVDAPKEAIYVSTMNLDGETNLKDRELVIDTLMKKEAKNKASRYANFSGIVECDIPNESLDEWNGSLRPSKSMDPLLSKSVPCDIKNLILRGMTLRNTPYCVGVVCYVGPKTKIFMNSKKAIRKVSNLMKLMNKMLYSVFAFQLSLIAVFSTLSLYWMQDNMELHQYVAFEDGLGFQRWVI
jgi:phospholipid-translocating ATPase